MTSSRFAPRTLASPTGATLNLYHREAEAEAIGVVQINHGLAEHSARYARFASELARAGFHVYAQDHRGHGGTVVSNTPRQMFAWKDGADKVIADVDMVHDLIAGQHPDLPPPWITQSQRFYLLDSTEAQDLSKELRTHIVSVYGSPIPQND